MKPFALVMGMGPNLAQDTARIIRRDIPIELCDIFAVNRATGVCRYPIAFNASWHGDDFPEYDAARICIGGNTDYRRIAPFDRWRHLGVESVPVQISGGSSALYAVLAALKLGYDKVIVAGVCLRDAGYTEFQSGWLKSLSVIEDKTRALSGYPQRLLGAPSPEWLALP